MNDDSLLSYRPSVCYFRRDLHASSSLPVAIEIAVTVSREFEFLRDWSATQGVLPENNVHVSANILREAIRNAASHGQAILLGLFLCHELEQLKAHVREAGLIPPKRIIPRTEAEDKGWELPDAVNQ